MDCIEVKKILTPFSEASEQQLEAAVKHYKTCKNCQTQQEQQNPEIAPQQISEWGNYTDIEKIGEGGMGIVYKAYDQKTDRYVALKTIQEGVDIERFEREIKATAKLTHPNIARIYHSEQSHTTNMPYYTMEYIEGETLREYLEKHPLSLFKSIAIMLKIIIPVAYAHQQGVIHRDLKPDNIMVAKERIVVMDFGIAKIETEKSFTQTGAVIGTPGYMSPEQKKGEKEKIDRRTDVYALGCIFANLLTKKQTLENYPKQIQKIYSKATAANREKRYKDAEALGTALKTFVRLEKIKFTLISAVILYVLFVVHKNFNKAKTNSIDKKIEPINVNLQHSKSSQKKVFKKQKEFTNKAVFNKTKITILDYTGSVVANLDKLNINNHYFADIQTHRKGYLYIFRKSHTLEKLYSGIINKKLPFKVILGKQKIYSFITKSPDPVLEKFHKAKINKMGPGGTKRSIEVYASEIKIRQDFFQSIVLQGIVSSSLRLDIAAYHIDQIKGAQIIEDSSVLNSNDDYCIYVNTYQKIYLYIYQIDATQTVFKLFPNPKLSKGSNPIKANTQRYFPSSQECFFLDENSGRENIFIFATKEPSPALDAIDNISEKEFKQKIENMGKKNIEKMGPGGTRKKKVPIKPHQKNANKIKNMVQQIQSKIDFFYKISFTHK